MGKRDARISRERFARYVRAALFTQLQDLYRTESRDLAEALQHKPHKVHWATTRIVADDPRKASARRARRVPQVMIDALHETFDCAQQEVVAAMAYFVPGRRGARDLIRLRRRGVRVRILTNSLASNDVPTVHAGYTKYRRALLRGGVELYEYQRFGNRPRRHYRASSSNALHAKTIVVDRKLAWIGSFNLDPRSTRLNTEMAVLLDSPALAQDLAGRMERDLAPDRSWRVERRAWSRELKWTGQRDGVPVVVNQEPDTGWFVRAWVRFARRFPFIERLL
jgi:putative cardiolipin synthase